MQNYHFNKRVAKKCSHRALFTLLTALIEVQFQATLYRAGVKSKLTVFGICDNVYTLFPYTVPVELTDLFFKRSFYPIKPYSKSGYGHIDGESNKEHRWGHGEIGNRRMAMLALMIKDLTHYLQTEA